MTAAVDRYAELRQGARVRDRTLFPSPVAFSELELQARWFAGDFGKQFRSTAGDEIEVVQFGVWNRESGPDFSDAVVRINHGEPVRGSIEFDIADVNWDTHGHAANAEFDDAVLHVVTQLGNRQFFTRTSSNRNVPQVLVDPAALPAAYAANVPLAHAGRCQAPLRGLEASRVESILNAAAQFRLRRKANRLHRIAQDHGRDEAIYQEVAAALGYKQNKLAFTLLAQRLPLATLQRQRENAEALLFGVAGFLNAADLAIYETTARGYVRTLWDRWWPQRDELARLVLPSSTWKLAGSRPLNHPHRRLAALAAIVCEWPRFVKLLSRNELRRAARRSKVVEGSPLDSESTALGTFFAELEHPFWNFHYTLTAPPSSSRMALVGNTRVADIQANVIFPWLAGEGVDVWPSYSELRAQLTNRRAETAATRLFGDDPRRSGFVKTIAHQQGLLQIYEDFCMQDNSDCARCPFPEQMQKWS